MPRKRQRMESEPCDAVRNRSTYWFEDGNVVLQAGLTLFRVHRSILTRHSEFFEDLFSLPQPPDSEKEETIDGCPVLHLSDPAKDVNNMLSLFYETFITNNELHIDVIASMLRLGKKYAITQFEREALSRLRHDYPSALHSWIALISSEDYRIAGGGAITTAKVIALALEFNVPSLLPAAYVRLFTQTVPVAHLPTDLGLPLHARDQCLTGLIRITNYVKNKQADACCHPHFFRKSCKCKPDRLIAIKELSIWDTEMSLGILYPWDEEKARLYLCILCWKAVKVHMDNVQKDFWACLPAFFDLPGWDALSGE